MSRQEALYAAFLALARSDGTDFVCGLPGVWALVSAFYADYALDLVAQDGNLGEHTHKGGLKHGDLLRAQLEEARLQRDALASALADLGPEAVALGAIKMRAVGL